MRSSAFEGRGISKLKLTWRWALGKGRGALGNLGLNGLLHSPGESGDYRKSMRFLLRAVHEDQQTAGAIDGVIPGERRQKRARDQQSRPIGAEPTDRRHGDPIISKALPENQAAPVRGPQWLVAALGNGVDGTSRRVVRQSRRTRR